MSDKVFVDTNILVCGHDLDAGRKHEVAGELLGDLWENHTGIISTQGMQEFYVNVTRKIAKPISPAQARGVLSGFQSPVLRA
jgi:predicted nucleic acid-binding protein